MHNNRRHFIIAGVLIAIFTLVVYWVLDSVLRLPLAASAEAVAIDQLFNMHIWLIAFLFSLIVVFMIYAIVAFRQRPGDEEREGEYFHSNTRLEVIWTVVPLIFVVFFGYVATVMLSDIVSAKPDEYTVQVEAYQWGWNFTYPDTGLTTSSELVLPLAQPVVVEMSSRDVLHDFWVPEFRVKQDIVPGHTTKLRFTPELEGEYVLRCAELCGLSHAYMNATVRVVPEEEFNAWMSEQTGVTYAVDQSK